MANISPSAELELTLPRIALKIAMMIKRFLGLFVRLALMAVCIRAAANVSNADAEEQEVLSAFLATYCFDCHDSDVQKAELSLEALMRGGNPDIADAAKWETALHMITEGEMPPKKKSQPSQDEREGAAAAIVGMLERWTASLGENPGRVTARRLNREEYNNTIRDLLGVDFKPAADFPRDEVGYGFDNIGDVLSMSSVLMERYLDAAEQVADKAIVTHIPDWPPVARPPSDQMQLLSWEEDLLRLPARGDWRAEFSSTSGEDDIIHTLTFTPDANITDLAVEGKRVSFSAKIRTNGTERRFAVRAEERSPGHLVGHWTDATASGAFTAVAMPGPAFAGSWNAIAFLPDGRDRKQTLTLEASDGQLFGSIESDSDDSTRELDEVTTKADELTFGYGLQFQDRAMDVVVSATLEASGTLQGKWRLLSGGGDEVATGRWKAERPERKDSAQNVRTIGRSIGLFREGEVRFIYTAEEDGEYLLRFASNQQKAGPENAMLGLFVDGREVERIDVAWEKPKRIERTLTLLKGAHSIGLAYLNNYVNNRSRERRLRGDRNLYVRNIQVVGPLGKPRPALPTSHLRIIPEQPAIGSERATARRLIREFASRAYRRPASAEEVERIAGLVDGVLSDGGTFGEGMQLAVQAVLVSPHFLFRWEMDSNRASPEETGIRHLNAYEIAARLSYFIWSSLPDDELFALAMDGSLESTTVIREQVQRMLADPKSEALVRNFAGQWLQIRNLDSVAPDSTTFPEFDEALRESMAEETYLFFDAILRENRSILELLDADFTFLNARLADHYGLEMDGIGDAFQRVNLSPDARRGGVLTHASVLTITSNPRRTSPVTRGKWVLEQILGTPPPPPPPNVPQLEETKKVAAEASLRERMRIHRDNPDCAGCHAKMDPIGFALENYDGIGRWRDFDGTFPIDSAVTLANGANVSGPDSLKRLLVNEKNYSNSLIEKMLTYSIGRGIEFYDRPVIESIQDEAAKSGFKLSTIVSEIACSDPFLKRTLEIAPND